MKAIDGVRGDLNRGVEAEGHVGSAEVVVDRLGNPENGKPVLRVQPGGGPERVLASDRYQALEVQRAKVLGDQGRPFISLEGIRARGTQDRAAAREDPAGRLDRQLLVGVLERPTPAVAK